MEHRELIGALKVLNEIHDSVERLLSIGKIKQAIEKEFEYREAFTQIIQNSGPIFIEGD